MEDRFTHVTKFGRGKISKAIKREVLKRDNNTCVYCCKKLPSSELTIDHLVPLANGGHDEITNYVTACFSCNNKKGSIDLVTFCNDLNVSVEKLPVYGDPIIDNVELPLSLRIIRKRIFDEYRKNRIKLFSKESQKKIEKTFRREFWQTDEGKKLEEQFPLLPGHVRIMIPEIQTIANSNDEYLLLVEMAKSANTRNLINKNLCLSGNIITHIRKISQTTQDEALKKRLLQALNRFDKEKKDLTIAST